jgi:hypothetical protein
MGDQLLNVFGNPFFQGVAAASSLIALCIVIFSWFVHKRRKLYVAFWRRTLFRADDFIDSDLVSITLGSFRSKKAIFDMALILNRTANVLQDADFVDVPYVDVPADAEVYQLKLVEGPGFAKGSVLLDGEKLRINDIRMLPGESLLLLLIHGSDAMPMPEATLKKQAYLITKWPLDLLRVVSVVLFIILSGTTAITFSIAHDLTDGVWAYAILLIGFFVWRAVERRLVTPLFALSPPERFFLSMIKRFKSKDNSPD